MNAPKLYVQYFETFFDLATERCRHFWDGSRGPNGCAASFESLLAFRNEVLKCGFQNPSILDAGAGASSCLLRLWFTNVTTCDPDPDYMGQVQEANRRLRSETKVASLKDDRYVVGYSREKFDATFYDWGSGPQRLEHFDDAIQSSKLVYFDDADNRPLSAWWREEVIKLAALRGRQWREAKEASDEFDRWGIFVR